MADNGETRLPSSGRGKRILELLQQQQLAERTPDPSDTSRNPFSAPSTSQTPQNVPQNVPYATREEPIQPSIASAIGRGRAYANELLASVRNLEAQKAKPPGTPPAAGRGSIMAHLAKSLGSQASTQSHVPPSSSKETSVVDKLSTLSVTDTKSSSPSVQSSMPLSFKGTSGTEVKLSANYINLRVKPGSGLFQYEVKYSPDIDSRALRRRLLNEHIDVLGKTKTFDGALLYLPMKLQQERTILHSTHPADGSQVTLTIIYKKQQAMQDCVLFFNVLMARIMRTLSLVRIGQHNFNPQQAHKIPQHRFEVWPGYVTAINEYEGGLKLCLDARHRVMRTDTVLAIMNEIRQKRPRDFKDAIVSEILGMSVLTRYNNKSYRIDDINWDKNPTFSFSTKEGEVTLLEYYKKHWNLDITNPKQPLLLHRAKEKTTTGETIEKPVLLVPELCYIAGLTDKMRNDYKLMRDLDSVTKIGPSERQNVIRGFVNEVQSNEITRQILLEWGLKLDDNTVEFTGRTLKPETILFGNNKSVVPQIPDWGRAACTNAVLYTPHLQNWGIIFCRNDSKVTSEFVAMLLKVSKGMCMNVNPPQKICIDDDRIETYLRHLRNNINNKTEMMVIIFPSNRTDRYSAVKKVCCVEKPIPSQVVMSRTISRADKLKAITEKIALQMNCKLGGALWALKMPDEKYMICGIDVYHGAPGKTARGSVAGFVASMDKLLTAWYSKTCLQGRNQELVDLLQGCLISAINMYRKRNGYNPDRIIIYRDGVGDGQLHVVQEYEVKQFLAIFARIDPSYKPELSIIIVQKRINTRLFTMGRSGLENPQPGTIADSCVTRRNYYDFFLVSQHVRQGTVTPTHYIVIYNNTSMPPDHVQRLTYKMCHLYYNWPGTIRVPAPCQYAHKLVYLVGENIQMEPDVSLSNNLFYL